jgi:hypothetical protein
VGTIADTLDSKTTGTNSKPPISTQRSTAGKRNSVISELNLPGYSEVEENTLEKVLSNTDSDQKISLSISAKEFQLPFQTFLVNGNSSNMIQR